MEAPPQPESNIQVFRWEEGVWLQLAVHDGEEVAEGDTLPVGDQLSTCGPTDAPA